MGLANQHTRSARGDSVTGRIGDAACYRALVRFVGALAFALGAAGVTLCVAAVYRRGRPADVGFALLALASAAVALFGLATVFVPEFLTG